MRCSRFLILAGVAELVACGRPVAPRPSAGFYAVVTGRIAIGAAPYAGGTVGVRCPSVNLALSFPTDSAGAYLARLDLGSSAGAAVQAGAGRLRCEFRAPAVGAALVVKDTVVTFTQPPYAAPLQRLDLAAPAGP